jgi:hypothetical protein
MSDFDAFDARLVELVATNKVREQQELSLACPAPLIEDSVQRVISTLREEFPGIMADPAVEVEVRRAATVC